MADEPLTDDEIEKMRERAGEIFAHVFAWTDVKKLAHDCSCALDEVERLREALLDVAETDTHDAGRLKWMAEQALEGNTDDDQQ